MNEISGPTAKPAGFTGGLCRLNRASRSRDEATDRW